MPHGGDIVISFGSRNITQCPQNDGPRPGRYVEIVVQDSGSGIPAENLPRIFEPFFTTKPAGIGTGLGLSVAYSIIQNHRGWLEAASAPSGGARISVVLPVV